MTNGVVTGITVTHPGSGYTSVPRVSVDSPPLTPKLSVKATKMAIRLKVGLGGKYRLDFSNNMGAWNPIVDPFVTLAEDMVQGFTVNPNGSYYRIIQVP